ncbi:EPIDERMAL PATTERNING FACTOR-like protein 5 [Brachypodium distachyon]|uniref:Epidermal patterning factor-like protein n=1 Tax=Brachypodium distachyon TaxID=15368 RepID=A0A0Q3H3S6_BRADI|nr:EPIDERMAL PATTERNING FACTOR-like protein 5 [Brachypodium distachyon]KQJ88074.1 hypothetical protein BRADI_4g15153v3 [Brachypodium distachyon]|eukprot:XP_014757624.1 EPIDERMAL PATTERNING FACTOR-like protein 5 [Brachypodium distachyon]
MPRLPVGTLCMRCSSSFSTAMERLIVCRRNRGLAVFAAIIVLFFSATIAVTEGRPTRRVPTTVPLRHMRKTGSSPSALLIRGSTSSTDADDAAAAGSTPRRRLAGPGSSPPTCRSRCGRCTPCRAVRVAIQPGIGTQWEYYPEVWRCKCGSKLYMP